MNRDEELIFAIKESGFYEYKDVNLEDLTSVQRSAIILAGALLSFRPDLFIEHDPDIVFVIQRTFENGSVGHSLPKKSLTELFEMYNKIPNDMKKDATAFCLDMVLSGDTGMFNPDDGSVHLSPTSLAFPKNGPDNTLFSMVHEFVYAHDYKNSGQWNISGTEKWHSLVNNNKPISEYAGWVRINEPYKYYQESLAETGAIYITHKISPEKAVFYNNEGNIVYFDSLDENELELVNEVKSYYTNLFE